MSKYLKITVHKSNQMMIKNIDKILFDYIEEKIISQDEIDYVLQYEEDDEIFNKIALVGATNMADQMMSTYN